MIIIIWSKAPLLFNYDHYYLTRAPQTESKHYGVPKAVAVEEAYKGHDIRNYSIMVCNGIVYWWNPTALHYKILKFFSKGTGWSQKLLSELLFKRMNHSYMRHTWTQAEGHCPRGPLNFEQYHNTIRNCLIFLLLATFTRIHPQDPWRSAILESRKIVKSF